MYLTSLPFPKYLLSLHLSLVIVEKQDSTDGYLLKALQATDRVYQSNLKKVISNEY